jgi:hypothetical protein
LGCPFGLLPQQQLLAMIQVANNTTLPQRAHTKLLGWVASSYYQTEQYPVQAWVSQSTLYFLAVEYTDGVDADINFLHNITIPSVVAHRDRATN